MSSIPLRRALLSAVTLFGGHVLNRRLDRVALIGALLVIPAMVSIARVSSVLTFDGAEFYSAGTWASKLPLILVGAVALLSAGLTFRDARQPPRGPLTTTIRIIRLPLTVFGALALATVLVITGMGPAAWSYVKLASQVPIAGHIYFGFGNTASIVGPAPVPPPGPHPLRGRITLDQAGLEGATIELRINGMHEASLHSDARGEFEVSLPAGSWRINEITVRDRDGLPKGRDLILFSPHDAPKRPGMYSRFNVEVAEGLEVSLPAPSNAMPVELEFRDALPITWPPPPAPGEHRDRLGVLETELPNTAIAWQPVKGASEYQVQISYVGSGQIGRFRDVILTRRLSGLTLPLASLPHRAATEPADQYAVHIFAFDAAGRLLTESNVESNDRMFRLTGATRLGKERQYVGFWGPTQVISAEYERNEAQLEKATNLVLAERFDEARSVLDEVTEDAPRGRVSALRGRIAALQGDCATAIKLFDQADIEGGGNCARNEDRKLCEAPQR